METFGKGEFLPERFSSEYGHLFKSYVKDFSSAKTYEERMRVSLRLQEFLQDANSSIEKKFRAVRDKVNFKSVEKSRQLRSKGNAAYQSRDDKKALKLYTKSISRAPPDSGEIALAYANRSAVLRAMKKCRECLVDLQRAFNHGYPTEKSFKLLLREIQCHRDLGNSKAMDASCEKAAMLLHALPDLTEQERTSLENQLCEAKQAPCMEVCTEQVIFPRELPALSYGANSEIVGASSAVRLEYSEQQGRHLVADRDIQIGDVLLITEILVATVSDVSKYNHCAYCQKPCHNLLPCPNCVWVMFCSPECQTEANRKYHRNECAPYSRMRHLLNDMGMVGEMYDRIIRLLAQIGIDNLQPYYKHARTDTKANLSYEARRTHGFNSNGMFDSYSLHTIFTISSMIERRDQLNFLFESNNLLYIPRCFGMSTRHRDFLAVAGLCLKLRDACEVALLNKGYYLSKPAKDPLDVALCFDPLNALVNHGCFYNLTSVTCGDRSARMAKWPIAKGSVLTEFYIGEDFMQNPKEVRQKMLKENYCFDCKCEACEKDWDISIKYNCISDLEDVELANKLFHLTQEQIVEMCRKSPRSDLGSKVDDFRMDRYELLSRLWHRGEFQDMRATNIAYQILVYNLLQGNRLMHHVGKNDAKDGQEDFDEKEFLESVPACPLQ